MDLFALRVLCVTSHPVGFSAAMRKLSASSALNARTAHGSLARRGGPFKNKREVHGKLLERTFDELKITQSGRTVRIPLALVDEVRLPPSTVEAGDMYS